MKKGEKLCSTTAICINCIMGRFITVKQMLLMLLIILTLFLWLLVQNYSLCLTDQRLKNQYRNPTAVNYAGKHRDGSIIWTYRDTCCSLKPLKVTNRLLLSSAYKSNTHTQTNKQKLQNCVSVICRICLDSLWTPADKQREHQPVQIFPFK